MSIWGDLIKAGYQVVYALEIDGIPLGLGAREMWTTEGAVVTHPTRTMSYGLVIREGMRISVEPDREKGLAAGTALDFTIGRQQIVDEGIGWLFTRPTLRANITSEIDSPATTTFNVDDTSGWPSSGGFYIGHEYCTYSGKTSTSFTGITRAVAGLAHYHTANAWGAYRQCTDTPVFWRGRLVTLWAHLVSPEGRYLGDGDWCTAGTYCRQEWRGTVRDQPRPSHEGMVLTCLPLVRVPGMEIGAEAQGRVLNGWIVSEPQDTIAVWTPSAILAEVPTAPLAGDDGIIPLSQWAYTVSNHLTGLGVPNSVEVGRTRIIFELPAPGVDLRVSANAWFIEFETTPAVGSRFILNLAWADNAITHGWLVVELDMVEEASDALVGDSGMLAIDIGDHTEIVYYDAIRRIANSPIAAFRIVARGLLGTSSLEQDQERTTYYNPWTTEAKVRVVAGTRGTWGDCLRTLLTSSGMSGARGTYDTLPFGFGAGLPDDWIAESVGDGFDTITGGIVLSAVTTQRASIDDLLCGWLALKRMCLVQRRQTDGTIRLEVVSLDPVDTDDELTDADVMLSGHEAPAMIEGPNHVRMVASDALNERPLYIVRDAARAQAEGVRSLEVKAPGITADAALSLGYSMILMADGQAAAKMQIAPWVDVQPGDQRTTTTAHPLVWDWSVGESAPESVAGVVTSWSKDLATQEQEITMLFAGQAGQRVLLCPSATVVAAAHPNYTLDDATGFAVGDEVAFYEVGNEDVDYAVVTITAIAADVITVDADPGVTGTEIEVTFADYSTATTRQRRHMFVRADKEWAA